MLNVMTTSQAAIVRLPAMHDLQSGHYYDTCQQSGYSQAMYPSQAAVRQPDISLTAAMPISGMFKNSSPTDVPPTTYLQLTYKP